MIGDGVNDSLPCRRPMPVSPSPPVPPSHGEISDITITSEDLFQLVTLRRISQSLMDRIHRNYRFIVGFNLGLILLGVAGICPHHLCSAAQCLDAGHHPQEHDGSAAGA